jgi:tetratricopeptide (TPR) repeat protein
MPAALEEAKKIRASGNHAEAVVYLEQFLVHEPNNVDAWWMAALSLKSLGKTEKAAEYFRNTIKLVPKWAPAWSQLGIVLCELGRMEEGQKAFFHALRVKPDEVDALRHLAHFARKEKDYERELNYLFEIYAKGLANYHDLNQIGIAAYNKKDFARAIEFYHLSIAAKASPAPLFNLALIYNDPEVSQDVDATDCLRRALMLDPDYKLAIDRLELIAAKLTNLTENSLAEGKVLKVDEWFRFYINPFEILQAEPCNELQSYTTKWIQNKKKGVKSDLELEDGRLSVLANVQLDPNRILGCIDELFDENKKIFHWNVFQTPQLLNFLTRGTTEHFLYLRDYFPHEVLKALEYEPFKEWLSEPFARQYDLVLTRALDRELFPVIESLFDGRRWVIQNHDELCFSGASRYISRRLEALESLVKNAEENLPSLEELESIIDGVRVINYQPKTGTLARLLNLLPDHFRNLQTRAVELIRSLALISNNKHGDSDLCKSVLELSKKFHFKSARLRQKLDDDFKAIEKLIKQERKHEAKYNLGKKPMHVTKDGVKLGEKFMKSSEIISLRWGINVLNNGGSRSFEFLLAFVDENLNSLKINWTTSEDLEKQQEAFNACQKASFYYIVPGLVERTQRRLRDGEQIRVGPCTLSKTGVSFQTQGWFTSKQRFVPWGRVGTEMQAGMLHVFDKAERSINIKSALSETENAVVLQFLADNPEF